MASISKKDEVYAYILKRFREEVDPKKVFVEAIDIEKELHIIRNNASTLLNELVRDNKLKKLEGRPVRFIINHPQPQNNIVNANNYDPFQDLIGYHSSLINQIEQAKAALLYPTRGLHTLILGESGTGKSLFARKMHAYLESAKGIKIPFVAFNCADYANNPQLLLSQLFGHVKGSFTGAISDRLGLVDSANGGILFLDEIHRLPMEGQEILFRLIDTDKYARLGEANGSLESHVLIIAATTEEPDKCLLKTFLRRIPVSIVLPSLEMIYVENRIELIESIFNKESKIIKKRITVKNEVLCALSLYHCSGNIGQLESDIKLICAKAYIQNKQGIELLITLEFLPDYIKNYDKDGSLKKEYTWFLSSIGDFISGEVSEYALSETLDVELYYSRILKEFNDKELSLIELYNLIDPHIVDTAVKVIHHAELVLNQKLKEEIVFAFSFHIKKMLTRYSHGEVIICAYEDEMKRKNKVEYTLALEALQILSHDLHCSFHKREAAFLASIFIHSINHEKRSEIGIILIQHGTSTASSMAEVCNQLFHTEIVKAIDVPLDKQIEDIYPKIKLLARRLDSGKGIVILADMGSTASIANRITQETGILIHTVENTSLPIALEITRQILYTEVELSGLFNYKKNYIQLPKFKKKAILTVCSSGDGVGQLVKSLLEELFVEHHIEAYEIYAFSIDEIENHSDKYQNICNEYEFILCVGSLDPKLSIPFVNITKILRKEGRDKLLELIHEDHDRTIYPIQLKDVYEESIEVLSQYVMYINPRVAMKYIKQFIDRLSKLGVVFNDELRSMFSMHICCMMERNVLKQQIIYQDKEEYIEIHQLLFQMLKDHIVIIEERYQISINEDEICYMIKVLTYKYK